MLSVSQEDQKVPEQKKDSDEELHQQCEVLGVQNINYYIKY